ncbi:MAG: hypothetical protein HFH14_03795 [Lachnospiraceae bacterium]|nr:hypothetical protein [Lachnospiraceae bacterium]
MYRTISIISALTALVIGTVEDIKYKRIHILAPCTVCAGVALLYCIYDNYSVIRMCGDIALGMGLILYSAVSHGKIGYGDGIIMCMVGVVSGIYTAVIVMMFASFAAFVYMAARMISGEKSRRMTEAEVPFVPFAAISYIIINIALLCKKFM